MRSSAPQDSLIAPESEGEEEGDIYIARAGGETSASSLPTPTAYSRRNPKGAFVRSFARERSRPLRASEQQRHRRARERVFSEPRKSC